jgi:hypothetical protein
MGRGWEQNLIMKIEDICVSFILAKIFFRQAKSKKQDLNPITLQLLKTRPDSNTYKKDF